MLTSFVNSPLYLFVKYFSSDCGGGLMGLVLALWLSVSACLVFLLVTLFICLNMFRWTLEIRSSAQLQTDLSSTHSLNPNFARSVDNMIFLHASQTENPPAIYTEPIIFPRYWRLDSKANKNLMFTLKFKVLLKPTKPDVVGSMRPRASRRR